MIQDNSVPEFKEVFVDGLHLMASPGDLISLKQRRRKNEALDSILRRFWNAKDREQMFHEAWLTLDAGIEFKLKREGAPYFAVYGTRGMGKSEVAAALMERLRVAFQVILGIKTVPAFGRNPSDMNQLLARATQAGRVAVVIGDETEKETGLGRNTEEDALMDNIEMIRLLLHPLIRCANRYQRLKVFSYYCDFVFEVIFQDRDNRVNYCIMYKVDEEVNASDPRIPIAMINIPLHSNEALRRAYQLMKKKEQIEFTSAGGRRSRVKAKMEPFVVTLMDYCVSRGVRAGKGQDITKPNRLLSKLVFHVKDGDKWNTGEQELICEEAYDRLCDLTEKEKPPPPPEDTHKYVWESDFTWREELALLMQDHPDYKQYHSVFLASEIMGLNPYKNAREFEEITHSKKSANWKWLNRMKNDEGFQGWLKETRAKLHEKFVAQKLRAAGWTVQEQPEFDWQGLHYQEDLYVTKDDRIVWINCKCGSGNRTYVADEYKTTYVLKNHANAEAYIVYLDLEENVHQIYTPDDRFSVGSRSTGLGTAEPADGKEVSTPLLLLAALAGPDEAGRAVTGTEVRTKPRGILSRPTGKAGFSHGEDNPMKRPDVKAKLKETINSPEFKVRHSASAKKSWQRPEVRSRHVESMNRPEVKVKISDLTRKAYQDPEVRAKVSGANSPRWRGGVSFLPYCPKFNESRKEEVRNGYERVCANCERTELLELHRLSVHHVDGDKMQGCKGSEWFGLDGKWFLVPLCQSCHGKGLEYDPYSVGKFWLGELARRYREKRLVSQDAG